MSQSEPKPAEKLSLKRETHWLCVILNLQLYISFLCGLHFIFNEAYLITTIFSIVLVLLGILGVTAGSHRLWAHHSYEATTSLRLFLMLCQTLVGHGSIYDWVKWHRLHHKYFSTDLDPYNPSKGFFYAHIRANNLYLSPAQEKAMEEIDMSDLEKDPIVMWQKRLYPFLYVVLAFLLPLNAPAEYWGETIVSSVFIVGWVRYAVILHLSWLIHSATTIWGLTPGEKNPPDSNLVFFITKSHWLNYHYMAPFDYQTGEFGKYGTDCTSKFIRVCAALELASDLKFLDSNTIRNALKMSIDEKKPIEECLLKLQNNANIPDDHYLTPKKFY